ncbi:MAG: GAF domain-containing protein [Fimbriimonadaceae bacterium]|nr:GAF domain-containing protein [Fimbriimonadaceae bacterium]
MVVKSGQANAHEEAGVAPQMPSFIATRLLNDAQIAALPLPSPLAAAVLRAMLLSSDEGVYVTDLEPRFLACNARYGEFFRLDHRRVVEMSLEELRAHVYALIGGSDAWRAKIRRIYEHPELTYEDEMVVQEPPVTVLRRRTSPIRDDRGEIVGRIWTFQDITAERKRQRIGEKVFEVGTFHDPDPGAVCQRIVETLSAHYGSIAILSLRDGDRLDFVNKAGFPPEFADVDHNTMPDSYCQVPIESRQPLVVQDARQDARLSRVLPARLGLTRYLGVVVYDENHEPIGTLCVLDDRSAEPLDDLDVEFVGTLAMRASAELNRNRAMATREADQQRRLLQQEHELAVTDSVLGAMNEAYRSASSDLPIEALLEGQVAAMRGLLGFEAVALACLGSDDHWTGRAAPAGTDLVRLLSDATVRREIGALDSASPASSGYTVIRHEKKVPFERVLGRTRGTSVVYWDDGRPVGLLVFAAKDAPTTDQRHVATHLEALIEQVSVLLGSYRLQTRLDRTQRDLDQAYRRLVQTEKLGAVGTLSASIAHEIRNIVAALRLEIDLGRSDPAAALAPIREHLDRFSVMSHHLLSFAKPGSTAQLWVDLHEVIDRVAQLTGPQARMHGITVVRDTRAKRPFVVADPDRCEHLFMNLILNGLQAMESKGGTLTIRSRERADALCFEIVDTGPGIPQERLDGLFEPFVSTRKHGFGLGLYTCRRVADEHGWTIDLRSRVGSGTTALVEIPKTGAPTPLD